VITTQVLYFAVISVMGLVLIRANKFIAKNQALLLSLSSAAITFTVGVFVLKLIELAIK
jgi:hypothetical protein